MYAKKQCRKLPASHILYLKKKRCPIAYSVLEKNHISTSLLGLSYPVEVTLLLVS